MTVLKPEEMPFWPWGLLLFIAGVYVLAVAALIAAGRREDARALAGFIPDCVVLVSRLARDRRISRARRAVLFGVLLSGIPYRRRPRLSSRHRPARRRGASRSGAPPRRAWWRRRSRPRGLAGP